MANKATKTPANTQGDNKKEEVKDPLTTIKENTNTEDLKKEEPKKEDPKKEDPKKEDPKKEDPKKEEPVKASKPKEKQYKVSVIQIALTNQRVANYGTIVSESQLTSDVSKLLKGGFIEEIKED